MSSANSMHDSRTKWIHCTVLVLISVIPYAITIRHEFAYDDKVLVLGDPRVQNFDVRAIVRGHFWSYLEDDPLYRPLATFAWALQYQVFGDRPTGYHVVSILLHAGCVLLVYRLARALIAHGIDAPDSRTRAAAVCAAALFALHPISTESVCWVSSQKDLLAALLGLAALFLATPGRSNSGSSETVSAKRLAMSALCWLGAMMAKENALLLIVPLAALRWIFREGRGGVAYVVREILWLFVPLAAAVAARYAAVGWPVYGDRTGFVAMVNPLLLAGHGPITRWGTSLALLWLGASRLVWPARLSADYSSNAFPLVEQASDPRAIAGAVLAILSLLALIWSLRDRRRAAVFVSLALALPQLALTAQIPVRTGVLFAERMLYLPAAALGVLVAWLIHAGLANSRIKLAPALRRAGPWLLTGLLAACGTATVLRAMEWENDETLFTSSLRHRPGNLKLEVGLAQHRLGLALKAYHAGASTDAMRDRIEPLRAALARLGAHPEFASPDMLVRPRRLLGEVYLALGQFERAALLYSQLARWLPEDAEAWQGLAVAQREQGRLFESNAAFCNMLAIDGGSSPNAGQYPVTVLSACARVLEQLGWSSGALRAWQQVAVWQPQDREVWIRMARLLHALGDDETARRMLWRFLQRQPADPNAKSLAEELGMKNRDL